MEDAKSDIFMSSIMKIPPHKAESIYNAVAVFTLPKSYLDKGVAFYLGARDDSTPSKHAMPNVSVGYTGIADEDLKKLYYSREVKTARLPVTWDNDCKVKALFTNSVCHVELACMDANDNNNPALDAKNPSSRKSTRKIP